MTLEPVNSGNERLIPSLMAQNPVCLRSVDLQMSSLRSCREFNSSGANLIFPVVKSFLPSK